MSLLSTLRGLNRDSGGIWWLEKYVKRITFTSNVCGHSVEAIELHLYGTVYDALKAMLTFEPSVWPFI